MNFLKKYPLAFLLLLCVLVSGCGRVFTPQERSIITRSGDVMYVATVNDPSDSVLLRRECRDLNPRELKSTLFRELGRKMLSTVTSPQQDGVGIAAPQVGLNVRLVALQRLDKEGEPFELYPNIHILDYLGETVYGPEGCLSVPSMRGIVPRREGVVVSFIDPEALRPVVDTVFGFTAVIFQHETDHLDGRLYTDLADSLFFNPSWDAERAPFAASGDYDKPSWWPMDIK